MQYPYYIKKKLEERAGFEPADGGTVTGFQDRLFQPLRHLSVVSTTIVIIAENYCFVNTFS